MNAANGLNRYSARITQPKSQGASQAMLFGTGLTIEDMGKPQVGIASMWYEGNTCNMHLDRLAAEVKQGVEAVDLVGMRFNTIGVSDGISMGTEGMSYSLQSRDLIADSIETVMEAQWYDANVSLPGCDKNMPGCLMAMARINRPSLMVYGGTIRAGSWQDKKLDIVSAFQCYGEFITGKITEQERTEIVRHSCPGAGACGGMYTANTMASAIEALGMSLPYSSSTPAEDPQKIVECRAAGAAVLNLLRLDLKPRDIMTRAAFENAMVVVMALGGSTNAVLHLIAMARAAGQSLTLDDFQKVSQRVPLLADLKPSGRFVQEDLHHVGGLPAVMRYLLEKDLLDGDCLTVTGKTLAENVAAVPELFGGKLYKWLTWVRWGHHGCVRIRFAERSASSLLPYVAWAKMASGLRPFRPNMCTVCFELCVSSRMSSPFWNCRHGSCTQHEAAKFTDKGYRCWE